MQDAWCQECHGTPGFEISDPITGEPWNLYVDSGRYQRSSHAAAGCRGCHELGYRTVPHTYSGYYPLFVCVDCHAKDGVGARFGLAERKQAVLASVHGKGMGSGPLDCHVCHDPHLFKPVSQVAAAELRLRQSNGLCTACHGPEAERPPGYEALSDARASHAIFPNVEAHFRKLKCVTCHAPRDSRTWHDVLPAAGATRECTDCHARESPLLTANFARAGVSPAEQDRPGEQAYVVGSTRSRWLDRLSQLGFLAILGVVTAHGAARLLRRRAGSIGAGAATVTREVNAPWLRLWHWAQAACFLGLLATGLSMHYADAAAAPVPFRVAVLTHNALGISMAILWLVFVVGNAAGGNGAHYRPSRIQHAHSLYLQIRYYLRGTFVGAPPPFPPNFDQKFNPVQKLAYTAVMYGLMPAAIASGVILLFPLLAPTTSLSHPSLWPAAMLHLAVGYLMTLFLVFHIYLATTGEHVGTLYREMVTGLRTSSAPPPE